jgi:predicted acetyltransferase
MRNVDFGVADCFCVCDFVSRLLAAAAAQALFRSTANASLSIAIATAKAIVLTDRKQRAR